MNARNLFVSSLLALCLSLTVAMAQTDHLQSVSAPGSHPRLLLPARDEAAIRQVVGTDQTWGKVHKAMLTECDALLNTPPVERIQIGRRLLDKSREALRRLFLLSYAWRMTRQDTYRQRAEKEMLAIAAFSDWNPSHFLDVAEMTMAVAIGYDWLYNDLSPQSRATIKEAILRKGIEPSLDPKNNSWLKASHNWNQVCNAGMTFGALAIYEDEPALAKQIINRALDTIVLSMGDYGPDGAYPEGYGYWGYGTSFNVMFISAMEKAYGQDFGLSKQPGFLQTAAYMENMTGPTGRSFNYSDAGTGSELQPAMFWFANKTNNPSLLWIERERLQTAEGKSFVKNRLLPAIMVWNGGLSIDKITAPKSLAWTGNGKNPLTLMRTSWTDPNAIFVGAKGGSPSVNHAHMDAGSFVMDANGVRWAMDFGMQDYNSLESKGVKIWDKGQNAQRWEVFRYGNAVHNTLTINDGLQRVDGFAPIKRHGSSPDFMQTTIDLSDIYKGSLAEATRGIAIVKKAYVAVRDELKAGSTDATVRWTLLTPAAVNILGPNRAELVINGKKLLLQVQEPATITLQTWPTTPTHDYDAPNPGSIRVGFEVKLPANTTGNLTVLLIPEGNATGNPAAVPPLRQWP